MSAAVVAVATDPIWNPHAWDIVSLVGQDAPGLAHVSEPSRDYEWDVKVGRGTNGATTTFIGFQPAKFSVKWEIWTASQMKAWAALVKRLKYDPTKIRYDFATNYTSGLSAIDIYHPSLAELDIHSVVVTKIGGLTHEGKGLYTRTIEFLEYRPAPRISAVATPTTSTPVDGVTPDPAIAQLNTQLADLQAQVAKAGPL